MFMTDPKHIHKTFLSGFKTISLYLSYLTLVRKDSTKFKLIYEGNLYKKNKSEMRVK